MLSKISKGLIFIAKLPRERGMGQGFIIGFKSIPALIKIYIYLKSS